MDHIIYNVPAALASDYPGRRKILRLRDDSDIESLLSSSDLTDVACLQLPVSLENVEFLRNRKFQFIPLDVIVIDPAEQFPLLYQFAQFTLIRATIASLPGVNQAVRAAASLNFAVKLQHGLGDPNMTDEMLDVLDFYLHNPTAAQPIEYFHSVLMSMIHGNAVSLWDIQEEEPSRFRYITDDRQERLAGRFRNMDLKIDMGSLGKRSSLELFSVSGLCSVCDFFPICRGYFKCSEESYDCAAHQNVFRDLRAAAAELKAELARPMT